jgi:carboxyl-terminal processing protease
LLLCWSVGYGLSSRPAPREISKSRSSEPNVAAGAVSAQIDVVKTACELIYQGKFDAAAELIEQSDKTVYPQLSRLAEIVQQYKDISKQRQSAREAAYQEQVAELQKLHAHLAPAPVAGVASATGAEAKQEDTNDVNDITDLLSVIAKASEFASKDQREHLLSDTSVKQTIQKAIDKAADFELQGKWLDAYINCYSWLKAVDPNNKAYSDYGEQLLDKASIVVSLQDSPCETREERYKGVEKEMFTWAVEVLSGHYVRRTIDYSDMARQAIRHCELLTEVIPTAFSAKQGSDISQSSFSPPDTNQLTAWSAGLAAISDEIQQSPTGLKKDELIAVFQKTLALNKTTLELSQPTLVAQFAEAALSALDPYTVMVWPRQIQEFEKSLTNEFTGIGIEISKPKGLLTVSSLLPDTPAYKAGLDAGDVIVGVDGVETKDMTLLCAVRKITGPADTKVTLTIKRSGQDKTREIVITRGKITVPTLRGWNRTETGKWLYMIDEPNKIGYIRITGFSSETASELEGVLKDLEAQGLRGLILDLRFNTGGLLTSAIEVSDKFLKEGTIVTTRSPYAGVLTYAKAHEKDTHPDYPLVILINYSSASASEIVAGALADQTHNRAILVGERTHGKGSVQGITHYPRADAQLKYTMAHYHLPSDQRVKSREETEKQDKKDWGIGPDIELELTSEEIRKMLTIQRENDILVQADRGQNSTALNRHSAEETIAADPQLGVGLLIVKTKLIEAQGGH